MGAPLGRARDRFTGAEGENEQGFPGPPSYLSGGETSAAAGGLLVEVRGTVRVEMGRAGVPRLVVVKKTGGGQAGEHGEGVGQPQGSPGA